MAKFLSIGEVVKMKGVSHRALRHYDEIGILIPAYTNPDTKYRYYSRNQMVILDIILFCVALDIPLQHFKNYILSDGSIDAKKLTEDAKLKALEKQKEIEHKLYFLDTTLAHFAEAADIVNQKETYTRQIDTRYLLTISAPQDFGTHEDYWTKITELYRKAMKGGYVLAINQGICFFLKNNVACVKYFLEIQAPKTQHSDVLIVPKAEFLCEFFEDACFFEALEKYQAHERYLAGNMFILNDILEENISHKQPPFEIQLML